MRNQTPRPLFATELVAHVDSYLLLDMLLQTPNSASQHFLHDLSGLQPRQTIISCFLTIPEQKINLILYDVREPKS